MIQKSNYACKLSYYTFQTMWREYYTLETLRRYWRYTTHSYERSLSKIIYLPFRTPNAFYVQPPISSYRIDLDINPDETYC